jgi:hypothetical protein
MKGIPGKGIMIEGHKPVGVLNDPSRIDAHMVRHHIAGKTNSPLPRSIFYIAKGILTAQVIGDLVIVQRIR